MTVAAGSNSGFGVCLCAVFLSTFNSITYVAQMCNSPKRRAQNNEQGVTNSCGAADTLSTE